MSDVDWKSALAHAIGRAMPNAEAIDFDSEPGHVYVRILDDDGERVWVRYRLSAEAQQFLSGEYPELSGGVLPIRLLAPPEG